ncbi:MULTISPECIES: antibiotic biosynthesis monooxygenase family protein [Psychrobacter]|uniref:antibiotic biosynthesis monooxygenase family protein n=1 Tax=Psychrobacter TaxID=497 RepID=UPI003FD54C6C
MIIVTFEIIINDDCVEAYLHEAEKLLPLVQKINGFISVERYRSVNNPEKIISVSKWEHMEAIDEWKANIIHQHSQDLGRQHIFQDYIICVSKVSYSYDMQTSELRK